MQYTITPDRVWLEVEGLTSASYYKLREYIRQHPEASGRLLPNGDDSHLVGVFSSSSAKLLEVWLVQNGATRKDGADS